MTGQLSESCKCQQGGKKVSKYHGNEHTKEENDNHSNQLNPNNDAYWSSRGEEEEDQEE